MGKRLQNLEFLWQSNRSLFEMNQFSFFPCTTKQTALTVGEEEITQAQPNFREKQNILLPIQLASSRV